MFLMARMMHQHWCNKDQMPNLSWQSNYFPVILPPYMETPTQPVILGACVTAVDSVNHQCVVHVFGTLFA